MNGFDECEADLRRWALRCKQEAAALTASMADVVVERARATVPVATGALREAIVQEGEGDTSIVQIAAGIRTTARGVRRPIDYAAKVEATQPFLQPAIDAAVAQGSEAAAGAVLRVLTK